MRELMQYAPRDCQPKVFDANKEISESREALAKELGKKPEELTTFEEETALNRIGLSSLDFND